VSFVTTKHNPGAETTRYRSRNPFDCVGPAMDRSAMTVDAAKPSLPIAFDTR